MFLFVNENKGILFLRGGVTVPPAPGRRLIGGAGHGRATVSRRTPDSYEWYLGKEIVLKMDQGKRNDRNLLNVIIEAVLSGSLN